MSNTSKTTKQKIKNTKNHNKSELHKKESASTLKSNTKKNEVEEHTLWWERRGFSQGIPDRKIATYISNKQLDTTFEPSMKMVIRIIDTIAKEGAKTKTDLSQDTSLNYTRLVKHVMWMEKKGLVESSVTNSRIKVNLTDKGKYFGDTIAKIVD
jgi:predicted transcriptional regulator